MGWVGPPLIRSIKSKGKNHGTQIQGHLSAKQLAVRGTLHWRSVFPYTKIYPDYRNPHKVVSVKGGEGIVLYDSRVPHINQDYKI